MTIKPYHNCAASISIPKIALKLSVHIPGSRYPSASRRPSELHTGVALRSAHMPHAVPARLRAGLARVSALQVQGPLRLYHLSGTTFLSIGGDVMSKAAMSTSAYV